MFPYEDSRTASVCPSVCLYLEWRSHHCFVNISPALVIDTSMESSSRVLQHGNSKILKFSQKVRNLNFDLSWIAEITLASSISVLHWQLIHQWKCLYEYYSMKTQKFEEKNQKSSKFEFWLVTKSWNHLSFVNISPTLVIDASMDRSSRELQHGNPKIGKKNPKNVRNSNFDLWRRAKITLVSSIPVLH